MADGFINLIIPDLTLAEPATGKLVFSLLRYRCNSGFFRGLVGQRAGDTTGKLAPGIFLNQLFAANTGFGGIAFTGLFHPGEIHVCHHLCSHCTNP